MLCIQQNKHQTSIRGTVDLSYTNLMFLELELNCVRNRSTCSRNSTVELLCGEVGGAELGKVEQSSPKQALKPSSQKLVKYPTLYRRTVIKEILHPSIVSL